VITALVVAVVLWNAALTATGVIFYRRNSRQHAMFAAIQTPAEMYEARFAPPDLESTETAAPYPIVDTVGAWAIEQRAMGIEPDADEIASQRQMRLVAGL
jgi:hypothetical protein